MKSFLCSVFIFFIGWLFSSCAALLGLKQPVIATEDEILRHARKYKIPLQDCYELDSNYFLFTLKVQQQESEKRYKDFSQPLQLRYYDTDDGRLQSLHINCYADRGGLGDIFFGLNWNKHGVMDQFPPLQQAPLDSLLSFQEQLSYMRPLKTTVPVTMDEYDFIVVAYWNMWMGKHSRKLVKAVKKNAGKAGSERVKILYANNENMMKAYYYCKYPQEAILKYGIDIQKLIKPQTP